ncbi:MAG: acetyl-CoA carboxylase biotin carboxylase subunit family protein [Desulfococcaceae bacterium]
MPEYRLLVVGTTSDYIEHIRRNFPGRAVFVTDPAERSRAKESCPNPEEEILCQLENPFPVINALRTHLKTWGIQANGVACFDCESLELAATLAGELNLPFPSVSSIRNCRNKFLAGRLWEKAGFPCPEAVAVNSLTDALGFMDRVQAPIILKPMTGSGSELVFQCRDESECFKAFSLLQTRLSRHENIRMYQAGNSGREFIAERFVQGDEYSCDFILADEKAEIIRIARKIPDPDGLPGTTLTYVLPVSLPEGSPEPGHILCKAAHALGLKHTVCMADFILENGIPRLLEMAPRPGGDCIPRIIEKSSGLDMIGLALDFAEGKPLNLPSQWEKLAGARLFAKDSGFIRHLDDSRIRADSRVLESHLKVCTGHQVTLPPDDYDSRILGHVIFRPSQPENMAHIRTESHELVSKMRISISD